MTQETTTTSTTPAGYTRSSFALPSEVHAQLPGLVDAIGVRVGARKPSVAALLTMLVKHQDEVVTALAPIVQKFHAEQLAAGGTKDARKQLKDKIKNLSPERAAELLRLMEEQGVAE